ncbi:alkaline phosphatase D family protein [Sphingomonas baiyangensis]|nr:alkaline phosphatase D family protein [Sphingomonas baiyangensis]
MPGQSTRAVRFTFAGDEAGQGFGINPDLGGYRLYEAMRQKRPDFFIHQGDQIYADGPLKAEVALAGGGVWRNLVTPAKDHVAETLDDFRGAYAYNLQDAHKRRFLAGVPMLVQWDDHEVRNNWWPGKSLTGAIPMATLAANARQALGEYNPLRSMPGAAGIYRSFSQGPSIEVFLLDARSRRGANLLAGGPLRRDGDMFGREQMAWLERALMRSTATWKVIASDIPLSLTVPDLNRDVAKGGIEGLADGVAGSPGGREPELARLLSFIRRHRIRNTVWLSADVHYAAAIRYEPGRAAFTDFDPFWEFVAGPINAGTGTSAGNPFDPTFGPALVYDSMPAAPADPSPRGGNQFFGMGDVDPATGVLTMSIHDLNGRERFRIPLEPQH